MRCGAATAWSRPKATLPDHRLWRDRGGDWSRTAWSRAPCDDRLAGDLERYAGDVARARGCAPTSQRHALVTVHYNTDAVPRSTLLRRHLADNFYGAAAVFARCKHAGGRVLAGLVRRRAAEAKLYLADR